MGTRIRVMPTLLYKEVGLVNGVGFDSWRRVGSATQSLKVYNLREVDELVFLDIAATRDGHRPDFELIDELADECFMPMTVGGGIRSLDDVRTLLHVGADKIAFNTAAVETPELITEVSRVFGAQCVVISIDYKCHLNGTREVYTRSGTHATGLDPVQLARDVERRGAGEILLCCIDRDGTMLGYDFEGVRRVSDATTLPVIASGGAGNYDHMLQVLEKGRASAVAAASIYHFTEQTPAQAKRYLHGCGIAVRLPVACAEGVDS